ncbi:hybrid sensor histidine kinase/response regulator [Rubrivivax albus]|uniref:Response regulator n=1 Tax=Rubrivivax albus TaxID=2499835 RepID=A0A437JQY2_9BURK|nr:response regulator [Rubrivivax albus]RVT49289.1 response regulator [Rubrivivax albus]
MASSAPKRPLRVLHLEDSPLDHELALAHLRRGGLAVECRRVESRAEFEAALDRRGGAANRWDLVLSDYNVPGFSGIEALRLLRERRMDLPFILVSGEIGEDTAVEAMRNGASDYLLKANLARLAVAAEHAIEAAEVKRAHVAADRALQSSREQLAALARHLQTSIEAERTHIAREIHDDVGGSLTALKFDLDWMRRHAGTPAMQQRATAAIELLTHAIDASKRIMHNLRPAILEQGLVAALQWMAGNFERRTGIECGFRSSHEMVHLPPGVPLVAYRMAQEALTNVSKHAQATRVRIELAVGAGALSLEVSDNGRGLTEADRAKARSFGLRGLTERASTVGGWVDVISGDSGTSLILSVPLEPALAEAGAVDDEDEVDELDDDERRHDPSAWTPL